MATKLTDHAAALKHRYRVTPGGPTVPGVTTVIGVLEIPQLKWASAKIAAETALAHSRRKSVIVRKHRATLAKKRAQKDRDLGLHGTDAEVFVHFCRGQFDRDWRAKADRGTRVHTVAEAWSRGESIHVAPDEEGFVDALERFHRDYRPRPRHVECILLNADERYGGRSDQVSDLSGPLAEGTFLLDWKTGPHYEFELAMQTIGYESARLARYGEDGALTETTALPELAGSRGVYLREDGTYEVVDPFVNISRALAWRGFLACRDLYEVQKQSTTLGGDDE